MSDILTTGYLRPFTVLGRRIVTQQQYNQDLMAIELAKDDLCEAFFTWLWISPVVSQWRVEPEIMLDRDILTDTYHIRFRARGWFAGWFESSATPLDVWLITLP